MGNRRSHPERALHMTHIKKHNVLRSAIHVLVAVEIAAVLVIFLASPSAQQRGGAAAVAIDADDIGGVVTGPKGPEAGVWVIAETTEMPTKFRKIVVTDDQGRYVVPDLPRAKYSIWVRGYGLADSKPVSGLPGANVNLSVAAASTPQQAASVYPANYWYSLIKI